LTGLKAGVSRKGAEAQRTEEVKFGTGELCCCCVVGGEVKQKKDGWMNGCVDGKKQRYPARVVGGDVAEDLFDRGLCLPSGTPSDNLSDGRCGYAQLSGCLSQ